MAINFNALVDEFKTTNWQDPGTWRWAPKILVLLAVLVGIPVAGFFADTQDQFDQLEAGRADEVKLKEHYLQQEGQAINFDLHRQQLREIDTQFGALLQAAAEQLGDGRAAHRHQPGRPRARPAVRAVQARGAGEAWPTSTPSCRSR